MRKAYLLIHSTVTGTKDEIVSYLNSMSTVLTWRYDIQGVFYIASENTAQELYEEFFALVGKKGRYMFTEVHENKQGQMLPDTWYFLDHKRVKPKE